MSTLDLELLLNPPYLTKESKIKKYISTFAGISKQDTVNKKFKDIKKIIYIHSFYDDSNPVFNINFLYEAAPKMKSDWFKYVVPDDITRVIKTFFDYLKTHGFLEIDFPNNNPYTINYISEDTFEKSIFIWKIPENFMPFFCTFVLTIYDYIKKKSDFSSDEFIQEMINSLKNNPAIDYTNVENTKLVTLIHTPTEQGTEILRLNINSTWQSFLNLYNKWLNTIFSSDLLNN